MKIFSFLLLLCWQNTVLGQHQFSDHTYSYGNSDIKINYTLKEGKFLLTNITSEDNNIDFSFSHSTGFKLGSLTETVLSHKLLEQNKSHIVFELEYSQILVRKTLEFYPDTAVVAINNEVKLKEPHLNIQSFNNSQLLNLAFDKGQFSSETINFFDQTDNNNTLVEVQKRLGVKDIAKHEGNIIKFTDVISKQGLFLLKEAPTAIAHLNYPGHDFKTTNNMIIVNGTGITVGDLSDNNWTSIYGVVIGLALKDELNWLKRLRKYQKLSRNYTPRRDDMFMMNTWGDRNKDGRVNEAFISKEIERAAQLGVTHYQIDDGWQQGLSKNSIVEGSTTWDLWTKEDWLPHSKRFPNGFSSIVELAKEQNINLGLWFHPSNHNDYENWQEDANILINLYKKHDIKFFKIDGVKLINKESETNLVAFFNKVLKETNNHAYFNLDVTADQRFGYHFMYQYGNIFLENRYTDFKNYYPHWTLRNLWMLSKFVPPEKLQIEFLNKWRNKNIYDENNPLSPYNIPFSYQFAIAMVAQPLAWFEASGLSQKALDNLAPIVTSYKKISADFHSGIILPIGTEPSGTSWTGFQSIANNEKTGYLIIYREFTQRSVGKIKTYLSANSKVKLIPIIQNNSTLSEQYLNVSSAGEIDITLDTPHSFVMFKYKIID